MTSKESKYDDHFIELVKGVAESNSGIANLKEGMDDIKGNISDLRDTFKATMDAQQLEINSLNKFRSSAKTIVSCLSFIVVVIATLFCGSLAGLIK